MNKYFIVLKTDGSAVLHKALSESGDLLPTLQKLVGGHIEVVPSVIPRYFIVLNEEGKLKRLPSNPFSPHIYLPKPAKFGDYQGFVDVLVGDIVIAVEAVNRYGERDLAGMTWEAADKVAKCLNLQMPGAG